MKKYKLKQWYPTLPKEWKDKKGFVSFNTIRNGYEMDGADGIAWIIKMHEFNNPDFWELIEDKKPLFITEDGVECFDRDEYIAISYDFSKVNMVAHSHAYSSEAPYSGDVMRFKYETNADEYIIWNKPLLCLQDIDGTIKGYLPEFDELRKMVEERLNHER